MFIELLKVIPIHHFKWFHQRGFWHPTRQIMFLNGQHFFLELLNDLWNLWCFSMVTEFFKLLFESLLYILHKDASKWLVERPPYGTILLFDKSQISHSFQFLGLPTSPHPTPNQSQGKEPNLPSWLGEEFPPCSGCPHFLPF